MCLYLKQEQSKPKVAEKAIECYKILYPNKWTGTYFTPCKNVEVRLGHVYRGLGLRAVGNLVARPDGYKYYVSIGFIHSFRTHEDAEKAINKWKWDYGFDNCVIVRCSIPKGSTYYEGVFEDTMIPSYASTAIRYGTRV